MHIWRVNMHRCPKAPQKCVWAALSSKAIGTPIEHDERSSSLWTIANPSKGGKGSIPRSLVSQSVSRAVQCRRSDRIAKDVEIAHDGMEAADPPHGGRRRSTKSAPEPVFGPFWAPNSPGNQKVDNVIGKILDIVLLNSPMHRAITSHR